MSLKILSLVFVVMGSWTSLELRADEPLPTLVESFQREKQWLLSQKDSLRTNLSKMDQGHGQRVMQIEQELKSLQRRLAIDSTENDLQFLEMQSLEKKYKDSIRQGGLTRDLVLKAEKVLRDQQSRLDFRKSDKANENTEINGNLETLVDLGIKGVELLKKTSVQEEQNLAWINAEGTLEEGPARRFGIVSAVALKKNGPVLLGPDGEGNLVELLRQPIESGLFYFNSMGIKSSLKHQGGLLEKVADFIPMLFLGALFLLVGGLFVVLSRE